MFSQIHVEHMKLVSDWKMRDKPNPVYSPDEQ